MNYIEVDHHGDNNDKPSSLEQVLTLLGLEPTRYQKLIAINDTSHIKGMEEFGASEAEINHIRRYDRDCQGITHEQEDEAFKIIHNGRYKYYRVSDIEDSILGIVSPHSKCACYTDNLEIRKNKNILIFTPNDEVNFFGDVRIINKLSDLHGGWKGGDLENGTGFWGVGIKEMVISIEDIIDELNK